MTLSIQVQLEALGLLGQVYKAGREIRAVCPFHDDHNPSMSVSLESGAWYCFTEGRGGVFSELLEELRRDPAYASGVVHYRSEYLPILASWAKRGITRPMLVKWGIEWDDQVKAMRLPVLNEDGEMEASIWCAPKGVMPKYRYNQGFEKTKVLFGLWRLRDPLQAVVLVEGPLDALWVQEAGEPAVAILGSDFSSAQVDLLMARRVRQVSFCFDNDEMGEKVTEQARVLLRRAGVWTYRVKLPGRYKDIQEVPREKVGAIVRDVTLYGVSTIPTRLQRWTGEGRTERAKR